jgi:iron complex outermembrane receptor protein
MFVQYAYERAPGNQLFWVGNPDLDAVKNSSVDAGFSVDYEVLKCNVNVFYSVVEDLIYLEDFSATIEGEEGGAFIGTAMGYNNLNAILYGGEASLALQMGSSLSLSASVDFLKGRKSSLDGLSADPDLAEIPPIRARMAMEYDFRLGFLRSELLLAEAMLAVDESVSEAALDGYTVWNLLAGVYVSENLLVTVGVENLSNQAYATRNGNIRNPFSTYSVPNEPGRFAYVSLKWGF